MIWSETVEFQRFWPIRIPLRAPVGISVLRRWDMFYVPCVTVLGSGTSAVCALARDSLPSWRDGSRQLPLSGLPAEPTLAHSAAGPRGLCRKPHSQVLRQAAQGVSSRLPSSRAPGLALVLRRAAERTGGHAWWRERTGCDAEMSSSWGGCNGRWITYPDIL